MISGGAPNAVHNCHRACHMLATVGDVLPHLSGAASTSSHPAALTRTVGAAIWVAMAPRDLLIGAATCLAHVEAHEALNCDWRAKAGPRGREHLGDRAGILLDKVSLLE